MNAFLQKIAEYIDCHQLLKADGKYLVALSGGADSVSLLLVLHSLGYQIEACHCNFRLRGTESDRDEDFCVSLCQHLNVPLHRIHFDTQEYAHLHKVSIEMAARDLRYRYFEQLRRDVKAYGICVAHHSNDNVETVLINLIRGTGLRGLTGISPKNGYILRPMLGVSRADILAFLAAEQQDFVTDSTNLVDDVMRNKIRLNILPLLTEINPSIVESIAATTRYLSEADKMVQAAIEQANLVTHTHNEVLNEDFVSISKKGVLAQASPSYTLYTLLMPYGFMGSAIEEILSSINTSGKTWKSTTHQLVIDRDTILVRQIAQAAPSSVPSHSSAQSSTQHKIPEAGLYRLGEQQAIRVSAYEKNEGFKPSRLSQLITLDADKVAFPLTIRGTQTGDRFHPFGMRGTKLVSDYLTDKKRNFFEKQAQRVMTDAKGDIIWLIGERTSDDYSITQDTTRILEIELINYEHEK